MGKSDTDNTWTERRAASVLIRFGILVGPLALALLTSWALTAITPTPRSSTMIVLRWIGVALVSTVILIHLERRFRKLLPLAALMRLSLRFPDQPPSRFRLAMRTTSTKQLQRKIEDARAGRLGETPGEAAERILELVAALNIHDPLTRGHSERVRAYSQMIGKEMGLSELELDRLKWAGLLHDIGKLLVPTEILNKSGKLTDDEFDIIKLHPEYGQKLVDPLTPWLGEAARAVWEHHERWSGGGYPRGIAGHDISPAARIVSVADTFDVITSVRSYKARTSPKAARVELARCAGTQFDPAVVKAFMNASIGQYSWMSTPAAWLAQTSLLPPAAVSTLVRAGALASGATFGGLALASSIGAQGPPSPAPIEVTRRIDDIELIVGPSATDQQATTVEQSPIDATTSRPPTGRDLDEPASVDTSSLTPSTVPVTTVPSTSPSTTSPPVTVPDITVPPGTTPVVTLPPVTVPPNTVPPITLPPITVPPIKVPVVSVPPISVPPITVPPITVPDLVPGLFPSAPVPPVTVPPIVVPPIVVPEVVIPVVTVPPVTVPPITFPRR